MTACSVRTDVLLRTLCDWPSLESTYIRYLTDEKLAKEQLQYHQNYKLFNVPEDHRSYAVCLAAVQKDGDYLEDVPIEHRDSQIIEKAIRQNGRSLRFVPENQRTYELCLLAMHNCGYLSHVPERFRDKQMYIAYCGSGSYDRIELHNSLKSYDVYMAIIENYPLFILKVPESERTDEMWLKAISKWGYLISDLPESRLSRDFCLAAVRASGPQVISFECIKEEFLDEELYIAALENRDDAQDIHLNMPDHCQTEKVWLALLKAEGALLRHMTIKPSPEMMVKFREVAVRSDPNAILDVPKEHRTSELIKIALQGKPELIFEIINDCSDTDELWTLAIHKNPLILCRDPRVIGINCTNWHDVERKIDTDDIPIWCTYELCLEAVNKNGLVLQFVPRSYKNVDMCFAAVSENFEARIFVPFKLMC
jgi:hypothetical protein